VAFTKHRNLEQPDSAEVVNKWAIYNSNFDKLDVGGQVRLTAAEAFAAFSAVSIGALFRVSRALAADGAAYIGCATIASSGVSAEVYVVYEGVVRNPAWSWSPGEVYVSSTTPGAYTQTPTALKAGRAISATELLLYPPGTR
jgi:hypothetical protein